MFRFEHPTYLFALLIIPFMMGLFLYATKEKQKALARMGDTHLIEKLLPLSIVASQKQQFKIFILSVGLLILAWANPQRMGSVQQEQIQKKVSDVIIALDVSNSMLATDVEPNRLERARVFALDLVKALKTERVGVIIFAGNAYMQSPLTVDMNAITMFLQSANPEQAPTQGTSISETIDIAEKAFSKDAKSHRVLVIISDGEDHDGEAITEAKAARKNNLWIFTVGVGTKQGGFMPNPENPQDYKRDDSGNPIKTIVNEQNLQDIASAGGGAYFNISNTSNVVDALKTYVDKAQKRDIATYNASQDYISYFQWFLFPAFLLLIFEFFLPILYKK
jgi:Ca-activated chloride channel homolog